MNCKYCGIKKGSRQQRVTHECKCPKNPDRALINGSKKVTQLELLKDIKVLCGYQMTRTKAKVMYKWNKFFLEIK
jgi:hypothetical protein